MLARLYTGGAAPAVLRGRLLRWYGRSARTLPWRRTRDPYAVLVSEVMLQQTQVSRVLPAYTAFLERFPTLDALSRSGLADVLRAWSGLGYTAAPRPARIARLHPRELPRSGRDWMLYGRRRVHGRAVSCLAAARAWLRGHEHPSRVGRVLLGRTRPKARRFALDAQSAAQTRRPLASRADGLGARSAFLKQARRLPDRERLRSGGRVVRASLASGGIRDERCRVRGRSLLYCAGTRR